jgi:hypothetical protein
MAEKIYAYKIVIRKYCRKRTHKDLKESGCECGGWIQLAYDRLQWRDFVNTAVVS